MLKKIKTKKDYHEALTRFKEVFLSKSGTPESDEADILALLIKDYEDRHFVIDTPDPIDAIKYRMEQQGITRKELAKILGHDSRVSDIFSGRRKLTLDMVRNLHQQLFIPLEALIR
jgi:HTH-type transcriptional regulator / antitoxin HigA